MKSIIFSIILILLVSASRCYDVNNNLVGVSHPENSSLVIPDKGAPAHPKPKGKIFEEKNKLFIHVIPRMKGSDHSHQHLLAVEEAIKNKLGSDQVAFVDEPSQANVFVAAARISSSRVWPEQIIDKGYELAGKAPFMLWLFNSLLKDSADPEKNIAASEGYFRCHQAGKDISQGVRTPYFIFTFNEENFPLFQEIEGYSDRKKYNLESLDTLLGSLDTIANHTYTGNKCPPHVAPAAWK